MPNVFLRFWTFFLRMVTLILLLHVFCVDFTCHFTSPGFFCVSERFCICLHMRTFFYVSARFCAAPLALFFKLFLLMCTFFCVFLLLKVFSVFSAYSNVFVTFSSHTHVFLRFPNWSTFFLCFQMLCKLSILTMWTLLKFFLNFHNSSDFLLLHLFSAYSNVLIQTFSCVRTLFSLLQFLKVLHVFLNARACF